MSPLDPGLPAALLERMILVPLSEYLALLEPKAPEIITTSQASERFSWSPKTWGKWARAGMIAGAFQDGGDGMWRLPLESCASHVERLKWEAQQPTRAKRRKPWGERAKSSAGGSRPEDLPERKVLQLRPSAVRNGPRGDARSETSRVAP